MTFSQVKKTHTVSGATLRAYYGKSKSAWNYAIFCEEMGDVRTKINNEKD
jgi:hypothetical protein